MRRNIILLVVTVVVIGATFVATLLGSDRPILGLDLQGGISIVLFPVKGSDLSTLGTATQIIANRVDGLGIHEADVNQQGGTVVIDLPGVKDRAKAEQLIGATAELRFRPVLNAIQWSASAAPSTSTTTKVGTTTTTVKGAGTTTSTTKPPSSTTGHALPARSVEARPIVARRPEAVTTTTAAAGTTTTTAKGATTTTTAAPATTANGTCDKLVTPRDKDLASAPQVVLPDQKHTYCYVLGKTLLVGRAISTAVATLSPERGWVVNVTFKNDDFVTKVAQPYVNQVVAIVLDSVVLSAPKIDPGITGRNVEISGSFSDGSAHLLAQELKYGALPLQFDSRQQTVQSVSPTLGKDQLRAGIVAGVIGLALVALYMIFFYRLLGLVVWTGLGLTGMVFFTLISYLSNHSHLTLTLAGVTGIIVSVGVTVDSYVVYFERLKDEVRMGKTVRSSLEAGFQRAFRTIIAADFVSLLGAIVLYVLTTGSVKGFAYFLGLSTILDLILAYCYMHPFVTLIARRPALVRAPGVGIAAGLDVPEVRA